MNACGIVTEYNPFHNGHIYHLTKAREISGCDVLVAVMSGNFVQRGEPAICDKWTRAATAIEHGVDLILELPFPFVVQSADHFAAAAVRLLALAGVNSMVFGSESDDLHTLKKIARQPLLPKEKELSFAAAFAQKTQCLHSNDLLGICYLRALQHTSITPYTIQRTNDYHDEELQKRIASATAIRLGVAQKKDISHTTVMAEHLQTTFLFPHYYPLIQTLLTTLPSSYLSSLFLMEEGIEHLFIKKAKECASLEDFLAACISKRYTRSRIQRTLIHLLHQTSKEQMNALPLLKHLRILAFNDVGKAYLAQLSKKEDVLLASRFRQIPEPYRSIELKSTYTYAYPLSLESRQAMAKKELQPPLYLK